MRRRDFIALFGCVTSLAWTKSARTQPGIPLIGFLSSGTEQAFAPNVAGFISGLKETGYIVGQNITGEYRWAESQYERLSTMANELARRPIAVWWPRGAPPLCAPLRAQREKSRLSSRPRMIQSPMGSSLASITRAKTSRGLHFEHGAFCETNRARARTGPADKNDRPSCQP